MEILATLVALNLTRDSWDLATCIPSNILGLRGYLPEHQRLLESLSLVTSFCCECRANGFHGFDLSTFTNLRALSWIGLRSGDDVDALVECLENNATHLRTLTLDLIDWEQTEYGMFDADETDDRIPLFADRSATSRLRFPALERLSLSEVSFMTGAGMFPSTFNLTQLKELRLWNCPGTLELLRHLTDSHRALPLVSLELVVDIRHADEPMERAVSRFFTDVFRSAGSIHLPVRMGLASHYRRHHGPSPAFETLGPPREGCRCGHGERLV